ncbi:DnaJ sub C member 8 [Malassezia sp. CBS 17886]|nr:DnaJ sub C member 8 [Malassezia sp. CBS 17886]
MKQEHNMFYQQLEIDRILMVAFRLNPYDVLDVTPEMDDNAIQKAFRRKSLLIHPDKAKHDQERAEEAFDLLKKASTHLLDEARRKILDETVVSARSLALKELGLPPMLDQDKIEQELEPGGRLHDLAPGWQERIKLSTKQLMLDDELRRRKAIRLKQEAEADARRERDESEAERKRKAEIDNEWESRREDRVQGACGGGLR